MTATRYLATAIRLQHACHHLHIVRIETFTYVVADGSGTITWNISRAKELIVQGSVMEGSQA
jgi:hypothetical protein